MKSVKIDGSEVHFFNTDVLSNKSDYHEKVYAHWKFKERQVWIYFSQWKEEWQTPEFLLWTINHEILHGVIDDILEAQQLWGKYPSGIWNNFPFICGIDEIFGVSTFDLHFLPKIQQKGEYVLTDCAGKQVILDKAFADKISSTVLMRT